MLGEGAVRITGEDGTVSERTVHGGFVSVDSDIVTIGVDDAELVESAR